MHIAAPAVPPLPPTAAFLRLPDLSTRLLAEADFGHWKTLRDTVLGSLTDPDTYVREDDEYAFFRAHLNASGQTVGVFQGPQLVAYSMAGFPGASDADNLGAVIGLPVSARDRVTHISSCMVMPQWRGNGLQRTLLAARLAMAQAQARPICLAMVSLVNHRSRHNLMRQGMHIRWTGDIDGLRRHVVCIDLLHGTHFDMGDERLIASVDYAALCDAARRGFVGVGELRASDDSVQLRFVRALASLHHGVPPR